MHISSKNQEFDLKTSQPLSEARAILADLTSHNDRSILEAAHQLATQGETEQERERGLALVSLLDAAFSNPYQD